MSFSDLSREVEGRAPNFLAPYLVWQLLLPFLLKLMQPQQQAVWMRARHGRWPTTGWEMTLIADVVGVFPLGKYMEERNGSFICLARRSTQAGGRDRSKKKGMGPS